MGMNPPRRPFPLYDFGQAYMAGLETFTLTCPECRHSRTQPLYPMQAVHRMTGLESYAARCRCKCGHKGARISCGGKKPGELVTIR